MIQPKRYRSCSACAGAVSVGAGSEQFGCIQFGRPTSVRRPHPQHLGDLLQPPMRQPVHDLATTAAGNHAAASLAAAIGPTTGWNVCSKNAIASPGLAGAGRQQNRKNSNGPFATAHWPRGRRPCITTGAQHSNHCRRRTPGRSLRIRGRRGGEIEAMGARPVWISGRGLMQLLRHVCHDRDHGHKCVVGF